MPKFKLKGSSRPTLVFFLILLVGLTLFLTGFRRQAFVMFQGIGHRLGLEANNISTPEYVDWVKSQQGQSPPATEAVFLNNRVDFPQPVSESLSNVLGETVGDSKWIEVSLSQQKLFLKDHGNTVASFLVSTGKWYPTPTGEWRVWSKFQGVRMRGGSRALGTYYDLPNVPYTMFYYKGYAIHGTYWHNNFGHPMSHGCINMKTAEAEFVFNWSTVGTKVIVYN